MPLVRALQPAGIRQNAGFGRIGSDRGRSTPDHGIGDTMSITPDKLCVLLISDTHGQLHPQILALAEKVGMIIHAGDVGHPDVLSQLAGTGRRVVAVRGNNDTPAKWPVASGNRLVHLEFAVELPLAGGIVMVEHGDRINPANRRHELLRTRYPQARLVLYGHSHRQVIDKAGRPWVVNPGAAGRSRTFGGSGCVLLSIEADQWDLEPFQFPLATWKS
jgi:putative phosphoesterase